ncbi:VOC family protein [Nocardioides sp. URHA0020]|uniref:VOC family protein n=1 Tax=Nocardioides sp. URHA0020 TaxID=1380392 RepID=UPI00048BD1F3|nr:VOC family protein [Nocardioides sp. URHA0020]
MTSTGTTGHPQLLQTVIDAVDVRAVAEFYRQLLGYAYRPGDEPGAGDDPDADDPRWLVLRDANGTNRLAFQFAERVEPTTWPAPDVPMQMHLDCTVAGREELEQQRAFAESLGARLLVDDSHDADEPLYVMADPAGHPFCLFVPEGAG